MRWLPSGPGAGGGSRARRDDIRNALCISCDAVNHRRRERIEEVKPYEVQAWFVRHDAALVERFAVGTEGWSRELEPRQSWMKARAPDDVSHVERAAIGEERLAVAHALDARCAHYTGRWL
jgi:hypothetical protein